MTTKKLALSALFICFAGALSALETMLPPIVPVAGIRVGLGNIVTLFILYIGGKWRGADALTVTVLRCFLAALITGSPMSALYGLSGGILACGAMLTARRLFPKTDGEMRFDTRFLPFTGDAHSGADIPFKICTRLHPDTAFERGDRRSVHGLVYNASAEEASRKAAAWH